MSSAFERVLAHAFHVDPRWWRDARHLINQTCIVLQFGRGLSFQQMATGALAARVVRLDMAGEALFISSVGVCKRQADDLPAALEWTAAELAKDQRVCMCFADVTLDDALWRAEDVQEHLANGYLNMRRN